MAMGQVKAAPTNNAAPGQDETKMFEKMLQEHNIDTKMFGKGKAKTLTGLAGEVRSGAARLMLDATEHKKLVRVVDVVVLRIRPSGNARDRRAEPKILIEYEE